MGIIQLNYFNSWDNYLAVLIYENAKKFYTAIKLIAGTLGLILIFPIYLIFLMPLTTLLLYIGRIKLRRAIGITGLDVNAENYPEMHEIYLVIRRSINKFRVESDNKTRLYIPKEFRLWHFLPVIIQIEKFFQELYNYYIDLSKKIYYTSDELGLNETDVHKANESFKDFQEDWD